MAKMKIPNISAWALGLFLLLAAHSAFGAAADWRNLSPKEKDRIQRNYQRWEKLPPQDKDHLRDEWHRYQRLPQDERERIKQRYDDDRRRRHND
jgi:hypothetical protein